MDQWTNVEDAMNDFYLLSDFGRNRDAEIQLDVTISDEEEIETFEEKREMKTIEVEKRQQTTARDADILVEEIVGNLSKQLDTATASVKEKEDSYPEKIEPDFQFHNDPQVVIPSKGVIPRSRGRGKPKPPAAQTANFLAPGTSWRPLPPSQEFFVRRDEFPPL